MAERKTIDWEKGEKLYRLGQLSAAEIGKQLYCSTSTVTRHMEKFGIPQDKAEEVRRRTREAIATQRNTKGQCYATKVTEDDIDEAVSTNIALVMSHRKDLQRLGDIEQKLLNELDDDPTKLYMASFQGTIISETVGLTVTEKASTLLASSNVMTKRVEKQRQAFSIDDKEEDAQNKKLSDITSRELLAMLNG